MWVQMHHGLLSILLRAALHCELHLMHSVIVAIAASDSTYLLDLHIKVGSDLQVSIL